MLERRQEGGRWLKARGLSQTDLGTRIEPGVPKTFVLEIERGLKRVPRDRFDRWAAALGVPPLWLAHAVMPFFDPVTFRILFGRETGPRDPVTEESNAPR